MAMREDDRQLLRVRYQVEERRIRGDPLQSKPKVH